MYYFVLLFFFIRKFLGAKYFENIPELLRYAEFPQYSKRLRAIPKHLREIPHGIFRKFPQYYRNISQYYRNIPQYYRLYSAILSK